MKISKKKKRELLGVVEGAYLKHIQENHPNLLENGPDMWDTEETIQFDQMTAFVFDVQERLKKVLDN